MRQWQRERHFEGLFSKMCLLKLYSFLRPRPLALSKHMSSSFCMQAMQKQKCGTLVCSASKTSYMPVARDRKLPAFPQIPFPRNTSRKRDARPKNEIGMNLVRHVCLRSSIEIIERGVPQAHVRGTCIKFNAVFSARFKGLSLYFID